MFWGCSVKVLETAPRMKGTVATVWRGSRCMEFRVQMPHCVPSLSDIPSHKGEGEHPTGLC